MKTFCTSAIIFSIVIFFSISLEAQEIKIVGTSQTTGHIATITVTNNSNTPYLFKLGPAIIPTKEFKTESGIKKSQTQMHTGNINREIAPGETAEIPVIGFCLDVRKPALPAGEFFPPFDNWITAIPTSPEPVNPIGKHNVILAEKTQEHGLPDFDKQNTFKKVVHLAPPDPLNPGKQSYLTFPGTEEPFNYKIDISEHPEDAALVLFPMVNYIISTYDSLNNLDLISTPFSGNADMQHDAVIQQTIWMATSLLQGEPYSKEDFTKNMTTQFEESLGVKIEEAPDEQKKQFNQGIDQFWSTFELVGEKAKVLKNIKTETKSRENENNCCSRIRGNQTALNFKLENGGWITLGGEAVSYSTNPANSNSGETIYFNFNIENAFCGMTDNQHLSELTNYTNQQVSRHTTSNGEIIEGVKVESGDSQMVIMGSPTNQVGSHNAYVLRIMKQIIDKNGIEKEISISLSIDKATCEVMVQLVVNGVYYENKYMPE